MTKQTATASLSFAALLRHYRDRAGLSQEELAERAHVSTQAIGVLERGERQHPYPSTVRRLAAALGVTEEERAELLAAVPSRGQHQDTARERAGGPLAPPADEFGRRMVFPTLPQPLTPLVGREGEVAALAGLLLEGTRLLTLTGPGGVGKTRLALAIATETTSLFAEGVAFVPLAPLADADLVLAAIAQVLGVRDAGSRPFAALLERAVGDRQLLLVLDNCEHVLSGLTGLADLLEGCRALAVLATSRAPLRVRGEQEYPVAPLPLPGIDQAVSVKEAVRSPAVQLFVDRAQAASPGFQLTEENVSAVAAMCGRLDGLPLAIELAAPRVKLLSPGALLARLHHALPLLTGGALDLPARQQTLRETIAWSYGLLEEAEQVLFRRLSVFAGGCTQEMARAVSVGPRQSDLTLLEGLQSLVDQSLLQVQQGDGDHDMLRFVLLETIREYACERLEESGEETTIREAHARCIVALAEETDPLLSGPKQMQALARLLAEQDNIRAALRWLIDSGEVDAASRVLVHLMRFWRIRGQIREARRWAEALLARDTELPPLVRARAYLAKGGAAVLQGDASVEPLLSEAQVVARVEGDRFVEGFALVLAGLIVPMRGDVCRGIDLLHEGLAILREQGDSWVVALALSGLDLLYVATGSLEGVMNF